MIGTAPPNDTTTRTFRVLLVDDSPTVRAVVQRMLRKCPDIEVVGEAEDGEGGIRLALELLPDVILMDIAMPRVDGFEAIREIMHRAPTAIVVFSTDAQVGGGRSVFDVYERGAMAELVKPGSPQGWMQLTEALPELIRNVAHRRADGESLATESVPEELDVEALLQPLRYLAVGASTGGPEALRELLRELAPRPPVTVLVVQHIAAEFEQGLVDWLRGDLGLDVRLARDGERPPRGSVRLAPQGFHLLLGRGGRLRLDADTPPVRSHRPSADLLLRSCAMTAARQTAGALLSGMGRDGVAGLTALKEAGGLTLVQDRSSSVVFGMPQAALSEGAAELALPPERIARYLAKICGGCRS